MVLLQGLQIGSPFLSRYATVWLDAIIMVQALIVEIDVDVHVQNLSQQSDLSMDGGRARMTSPFARKKVW